MPLRLCTLKTALRRHCSVFALFSLILASIGAVLTSQNAAAQNFSRQDVVNAYRKARADGTLGKGGVREILGRQAATGVRERAAAASGVRAGRRSEASGADSDPLASAAVDRRLDVAYGRAPLEKMDVYIPKHRSSQKMPILFFLHGGGWRIGDKKQHGGKGILYANNSIIFVNANYGLAPQVVHPQQAMDVAKAIKYTVDHAQEWGGDSERIFLMGHSAGAHLVDLIATNQRFLKEVGVNPLSIKGVISLDTASLDLLERTNEDSFEGKHVGGMIEQAFGKNPEMLKDGSPTLNITKGAEYPKFLMFYGERRRTAQQHHDAFSRRMRSVGGEVSLKPVPLSHRDINLAAGDSSSQVFKQVKAFIESGNL